ncbi:hypothetical protein [Pararhodobacter sp.]
MTDDQDRYYTRHQRREGATWRDLASVGTLTALASALLAWWLS